MLNISKMYCEIRILLDYVPQPADCVVVFIMNYLELNLLNIRTLFST